MLTLISYCVLLFAGVASASIFYLLLVKIKLI